MSAGPVQALRFLIVGTFSYLLGLGVFAGLSAIGVNPFGAATLSLTVQAVVNFSLNRAWSFGPSDGPLGGELWRFAVVCLLQLGINLACLALFLFLGLPPVPAQAIAVSATAPVGFYANRQWTFRSA